MASSINFLNWFGGENWFHKPSKPISLSPSHTNFILSSFSQKTHSSSPLPNFACISTSNNLSPTPVEPTQPPPPPETGDSDSDSESPPSIKYKQLLEQFFWECENLPDYRHTPEVENILKEDSILEDNPNPTQEEIEENAKWWDSFNNSSVVQFLKRAQVIADAFNEKELFDNRHPFRTEDRDLWKDVPNVPGLDGRPMPRKAIKTSQEAEDKFWDFTKQFFFGLWGFRQRPYPPGRPIDISQAFGYNKLEKRYYDFIMRSGGWFYKDRLGRTRGPLELITLKTAWGAGIIDKDTFIWGEDMDEWAPIHMVYGLEKAIATWEVRLGAAATAFIHKLMNGIPPWVPVKGHEGKTYKQLQKEAIESKRRDLAVLQANGGVWPGVRTPSHALFLWASGSELTSILEADHMPNKYIPKDLRIQLAKAIPGLRPWEILSIEQAMDQITYGGEWYREPFGSYTTGPPYIREWNEEDLSFVKSFIGGSGAVYRLMNETIPGFKSLMEQVEKVSYEKEKRRIEKRAAAKRAEEEINIFGRPISKA